jgi:endonuclease YncB( thermonuclease family)
MDYVYDAEVLRVVDGDTVYLRVFKEVTTDFGFHVKETTVKEYSGSFRLFGIDTPEPRGRKAKPVPARAATERLKELLASAIRIEARTLKDPDNFGRYLVTLIVHLHGEEINVNEALIKEGHAVPYRR